MEPQQLVNLAENKKKKIIKLILKWFGKFILLGIAAITAFYVFLFLFISLEDWFVYNISYLEYKNYLIIVEIFSGTIFLGILIYCLISLIRPIKRKLKTISRIIISLILGGAIFNLVYWLTHESYSDAGLAYAILSGIPAFTIIFYWILNKFFKKRAFLKIIVIILIVIGFIVFYRIQYNYLVKVLGRVKNINSIKYDQFVTDGNDIFLSETIYIEDADGKSKLRHELKNLESDSIRSIRFSLMDSEGQTTYSYLTDANTAKERKYVGDENRYQESRNYLYAYLNTDIDNEDSLQKSKFIIVGVDNIDGKKCLVVKEFNWLRYFSSIYDFTTLTRWVWIDYGLTIKSKLDKHSSVKKENIEVNIDIPDDLFILPQGVTITTATTE